MIRLVLVDDHRMFRESLRKILTLEKIATVLAEASDGFQLLEILKHLKPDIILMDISMPDMDGVEATRRISKLYPEIKILALSSFGDETYYFKMIESGAHGFLLKNAGIEELQTALHEIVKGNTWFSPSLMQTVVERIQKKNSHNIQALTDREVQIIKLICGSFTNEQIAEKINLSLETIKWHRSNIMLKTGSGNTAGLVIYAIKNRIIEV